MVDDVSILLQFHCQHWNSLYEQCQITSIKNYNNKKVLLRERKRHTDRRVASARYAVPVGGGVPTLGGGVPTLVGGVPTLVGGGGYLPWTGGTYSGGGGTYPGGGGYLP